MAGERICFGSGFFPALFSFFRRIDNQRSPAYFLDSFNHLGDFSRSPGKTKKKIFFKQMKLFLPIAQIVVSILLIIAILLQQRGTALGSAFGGSGGFYAPRRGIQQKLF